MPKSASHPAADRAIGPGRLAALAVLAGMALRAEAGGAQIGIAPPRETEKVSPDAGALLGVVLDPHAERPARAEAADRLLERSPESPQVASLSAILADPTADGTTKAVVLEAIARTVWAPPGLFDAVAALVRAAGNEDLPNIVPSLASFRTRDAARLLVDLTVPSHPWVVRQAAFSALARLSGRDDLGSDPAAWQGWFDSVAALSEADWRARLASNQARRADRLASQLAAAQEDLGPLYRRLYGQLPPADRPALLTEMLRDRREGVRTLGFGLAALELSSGKSLPVAVSDAAVSLLADDLPQTRARAAVLLDQIARPDTSVAVIDALNREEDPDAAAALLAAAARWPSPVARASILRWLGNGPATRQAAAKAALALVRADLLSAPEDRERAGAALRAAPLDQLGTTELRLLVAIGTDDDRGRVAALLDSSVAANRLAATDALSGREDFLGRLLDAASRDSDLFSAVVESVVAIGPTAGSYADLATLPAPDQQTREAGLLRVAGKLTASDLLTVASATDDPTLAAALLDRLSGMAAAADAGTAKPVAKLLLLLADLRLTLGQPDRALGALDLLDTLTNRFPGLPADGAADLRVTAYVWLDRLDRAAAAGGSAEAWIRGLRLSKGQPHARMVINEVRSRFGGRLSPDQVMRLAVLESQVAEREREERSRFVGPPAPERAR